MESYSTLALFPSCLGSMGYPEAPDALVAMFKAGKIDATTAMQMLTEASEGASKPKKGATPNASPTSVASCEQSGAPKRPHAEVENSRDNGDSMNDDDALAALSASSMDSLLRLWLMKCDSRPVWNDFFQGCFYDAENVNIFRSDTTCHCKDCFHSAHH